VIVEAFVAQTNEAFTSIRAKRFTAEEDVAKVIFEAATDGTDRLRYVAAAPDIEPLVKARRKSCEDSCIANMRSQFSVTA
jgi:hypothetical protein